tara:strand:- start:7038 stop:7478 length:441 start_codon:yes stop_codon:yes gene_type:complete
MHSILPHYDVFNPELKYERTDAINDTLERLNNGFVEFLEEDFEAALLLPLPQLALHLDCERSEAHNFRRMVVKEIDKTRRLAFTPEKIRTIKFTAENVVINLQEHIDLFGEPPYEVKNRLEVLRLNSKIMTAKELIQNCNKLLSQV